MLKIFKRKNKEAKKDNGRVDYLNKQIFDLLGIDTAGARSLSIEFMLEEMPIVSIDRDGEWQHIIIKTTCQKISRLVFDALGIDLHQCRYAKLDLNLWYGVPTMTIHRQILPDSIDPEKFKVAKEEIAKFEKQGA